MASPSPKDLDIDGEQQAGDPSSPPFNDLDSFLLDFDPVMEWLVDPDLDLTVPTATEESAIPSPGALDPAPIPGEEPAALSIDEKMDKISLTAREPSDKPDAGPEAAATAAKVQNDGAIDVCLINDPIKVAHVSEEESGGSETESSSSDEDDSSSSDESSSSSSDEDSGRFDARRMEGGRGDEMEEGEIRDNTLEEEVAAALSDGDEDVVVGPIRSKHEAEVLPPVPQVQVSLQQHHQPLPVGAILSIVGTRIIVEGLEKHNPLNEGSVLWITESRSPLGLIDETFGPVKSPYYIVRHNSEEDVPVGINVGTAVSYVMEFANCILNEKELYKKGYDASGENDEEATDEVEFSDDEKEAEYKRSLRQTKRATNDTWHRNQETEIDKWANFRGSPSSSRWHKKPEFAPDKRMSKFMGGTANDRWQRGNQDSIIDKRTSVKGTAANDKWQRNQESATDKRANFTDTSIEKHMQPHVFSVPPDQPLSHVPSFGPNIGSGSSTSVGSGNAFVNNQAITPDLLQALQLGNFFSNPSQQQLLLQQANALLGNGFLPLQHMGIQGGGQMNSLPSQHAGNTTFNQQNTTFNQQQHNQQQQNQQPQNQQQQNYLFNCLANALPFQQQFIPNLGAPTNFPWFGGLPNLSVGSTPFEAARQPNASHAPFGFSNVHGQANSVSTNAQSYGLPPSEVTQGMTHTMQFNPSIGPTSLGPMGQPNVGQASSMSTNILNKFQEEGASVSNGQSHGQPTSGILGGDLHPPMQCNPSIFPASIGPAPSVCTNRPEKGHGILDPCNAHSYGQPLPLTSQGGMHPIQSHPSIDPRLLGSVQQSSVNQTQLGCSDMQEQGSSGSPNLQAYGQSNPSINQGIMRPPMQFNSSSGPFYTGTAGPTNVGQVPFGCSNMEQRPSGSFPHNYKQPSASIDQRPPTQFNPGRSSSFRGRKQHPRGRHSFRGGV